MVIEIVDLPIKHDFPVRYVKLPEGIVFDDLPIDDQFFNGHVTGWFEKPSFVG